MSKARPKRILENVPEDGEAGWAPGSAFAEGGLHIPSDDPTTSTQEGENHRRESVAALQKAGNVRSRLAAFEATLKLEPVEEVQVRKSWRPSWKKPKKETPEALASPRNAITKSFAALRKSVPDSPASAPLSDANTPLRTSTGTLTPRGRDGSPFLKTVQGFLALRRSSASGLSVASQASPTKEDSFSPLGSGLSTTAGFGPSEGDAHEQLAVTPLADAAGAQQPAQDDASGLSPAPSSAGKAAIGMGGTLAARLACEAAALRAREKASADAAALTPTPATDASIVGESSDISSAATASISPSAEEEALQQIMRVPLMMTVGAAEPAVRRKGLRSPVTAKGSPTCTEAADEGTTASPAKAPQTYADFAIVGLESPASADAVQAEATLAPALAAASTECLRGWPARSEAADEQPTESPAEVPNTHADCAAFGLGPPASAVLPQAEATLVPAIVAAATEPLRRWPARSEAADEQSTEIPAEILNTCADCAASGQGSLASAVSPQSEATLAPSLAAASTQNARNSPTCPEAADEETREYPAEIFQAHADSEAHRLERTYPEDAPQIEATPEPAPAALSAEFSQAHAYSADSVPDSPSSPYAPQCEAAPEPAAAAVTEDSQKAALADEHVPPATVYEHVEMCAVADEGLGEFAEHQPVTHFTPMLDCSGSADDAARTPMGPGIAVPHLDIPGAEAATPEGSASGQQISPLLMSIKKLVSHQDAIESEGSLAHTPAADGSIADGTSPEGAEHLPAPALSDSPSPIPQGPYGRRMSMLEAHDISDDITSPILGSSELRNAVAAAQARVAVQKFPDLEQNAEVAESEPDQTAVAAAEHSVSAPRIDEQSKEATIKDESKPEDIPVGTQDALTNRQGVADAPEFGSEQQAENSAAVMGPSDVEGNALPAEMWDSMDLAVSSPGAGDQPSSSQALVEEDPQQDRSPEGLDTSEGTADATVHGRELLVKEPQAANSESAYLQQALNALSTEVHSSSSSTPALSGSSTGTLAQHASYAHHAKAAASPFHTLASPIRPLEGSHSPELVASMSPGTPAQITLQPEEAATLPSSARPVLSPSMQVGPESWLSPAATELEEGCTPASHRAEASTAQITPADIPAYTGSLSEQLQKLGSGDLDDASSATETCETASIGDSDIQSEATFSSAADAPVQSAQPVLGTDTEQIHATPEQPIKRGLRTPERELSPPQRSVMDGAPFTAAAALMLRSPGGRHSPLSPRSRLSPRSVPPLPHSRLFAVSPRSSSSPELDSPLEEAVDELISAACNLEDVQVPPSTIKKAGSRQAADSSEADSPGPLSMLLPVPADHSMPVPAGTPPHAGIMFGQHVQPLVPFPMGDSPVTRGGSPALGTGYRAPQNTPAAALLGSSSYVSMTSSPYQPAESVGGKRLFREEGAMVFSSHAEAPGVQDLLAAFRRAAGQERPPPASPAPVQPYTPASLEDSSGNVASQAGQIATGKASSGNQPMPEADRTGVNIQGSILEDTESDDEEQTNTAAEEDPTFQGDAHGTGFTAAAQDMGDSETATAGSDIAEASIHEEPLPRFCLASMCDILAEEAAEEGAPDLAAEPHAEHAPAEAAEEGAPDLAAEPHAEHAPAETATGGDAVAVTDREGIAQSEGPGASAQKEIAASMAAAEDTVSPAVEAASALPQEKTPQDKADLEIGQKKSPSKAARDVRSPRKAGKSPRPQKLQLEDAENVPSPSSSPGQLGSSTSWAPMSPSKLAQKPCSPGSQLRSPLAQHQVQTDCPAQELDNQGTSRAGEAEQPQMLSPAPIEMHQGSSAGAQPAATPATAPRAANPAAFLRNTNSIYSPDVPAEAGTVNRQIEPESPAPEEAEDSAEDMDAKFNLAQFSPPAARRLSTGQTPPLPAAMARSGSQPPSSRRSVEPPQQQPGQRQLHVTFDLQSTSVQKQEAAVLPTPARGPEQAGGEHIEPESPVFDESFALDAQLILGSLVTPATVARPPGQHQVAPSEAAQQAEPEGPGASQKACEIVEEAAAEAGLIKADTARLVKVMGPFLDALMGELSESEAQRSVPDLAAQELRQKCEVLIDENRQLRKDLQEQETEMFKVREEHAQTEQQFKTLYRSKYLPLKEEVQDCRQDIARLKACRAADAEACEKWRAQVATQQLQIRKADTDAEASSMKIRNLQSELQAASAAAAKAALLQEEADKAALQAAKKASKLEDQLRAAKAENEVLIVQSEEASARVAAAQAARDRAVKEGYAKEEESFSLKKRLQEFKRENDKFADIKAQLKRQIAQLQDSLTNKDEENQNLLNACEQLVSEREAARAEATAGAS